MKKEDANRLWLNTLSGCNEAQRRRLAGIKVIEIGWGGLAYVCNLTGMSHHTVIKGMREVRNIRRKQTTRIRKEGGGRKKTEMINSKLKENLGEEPHPKRFAYGQICLRAEWGILRRCEVKQLKLFSFPALI